MDSVSLIGDVGAETIGGYTAGDGILVNGTWDVETPVMPANSVTSIGYLQTWPTYCTCPKKSAREQVQDEILMKMVKAVESEDYKAARELAKLAKAIKEL